MRYYHTFHNYRIFFFPESLPSVGLFVHGHFPIGAVKQINIIFYSPLLSVYNITLLTANIIFSLWETPSQTQSHIRTNYKRMVWRKSIKKKKKIISVLGFKRDNKHLKLGRSGWRLERPAAWSVGQWSVVDYLPVSLSLSFSRLSLFSFLFFFYFLFFIFFIKFGIRLNGVSFLVGLICSWRGPKAPNMI